MADPVWVDGVTLFNAANMNKLQTRDEKGQPSGYAGLDGTGKVPAAQLPASALPPVVNGQWLKGVGGAAVWASITPADIAGYPADGTKVLYGDGTWRATSGGFPVGFIGAFGAAAAPSGWLLCDGTSYTTAAQAALFAVIQYLYGGSGANFNVPDLRGRAPIGYAPGGHVDVATLGANDGVALANRRPRHSHTVNPSAQVITGGSGPAGVGGGASLDPLVVGPSGTNPVDAPAWEVVNYIIRAS